MVCHGLGEEHPHCFRPSYSPPRARAAKKILPNAIGEWGLASIRVVFSC